MLGNSSNGQKGYGGYISAIRSRLTFRPLLYGYSNARVRAMRTALMTRRQAEELLKLHTNAAVAEFLSSRTAYREDFANMQAKITDEERVETAVSRNFARTAQKLIRITPEQSKITLRAFLGRYDVHNLKAILLAKKLGKSREDAQHLLIPAGSLSKQELSQMLGAKSADELYEAIRASGFGAKFLSSASSRHSPCIRAGRRRSPQPSPLRGRREKCDHRHAPQEGGRRKENNICLHGGRRQLRAQAA